MKIQTDRTHALPRANGLTHTLAPNAARSLVDDQSYNYNVRGGYWLRSFERNQTMRIETRQQRYGNGLQRQEVGAAIAEFAGLFLIFIVSFTGRDAFGDNVKTMLIILTFIVGGLGVGAGVGILWRGVTLPGARIARFLIGALMIAAGVYSILHVAS